MRIPGGFLETGGAIAPACISKSFPHVSAVDTEPAKARGQKSAVLMLFS
jgi:hypothetical protein